MHWQEIGAILLLGFAIYYLTKSWKKKPIIVVAEIVDVIK
tara:strand:+ start:2488 stop:2607 length:120 start_codon:yes stop_codon:yes gene_type:complete